MEAVRRSTSRSPSLRELASQLATATFIAGATGELVFYNEPAEEILGRTFAEAEVPCPRRAVPSTFNLEDPEGGPLAMDRISAAVALMEQR